MEISSVRTHRASSFVRSGLQYKHCKYSNYLLFRFNPVICSDVVKERDLSLFTKL